MELFVGDITLLECDAIVNAANQTLLGGGGVDGAIHRAAGPMLRESCRKLKGCRTGEAKMTPGFGLPAKFVIHTVGPIWQGGKKGEPELLAACYRTTLQLALEKSEIRSIAFPGISTGVFGYPKEQAAAIAVDTCQPFSDRLQITFCCFSESDRKIYAALLD